jgi:hypothetical protein
MSKPIAVTPFSGLDTKESPATLASAVGCWKSRVSAHSLFLSKQYSKSKDEIPVGVFQGRTKKITPESSGVLHDSGSEQPGGHSQDVASV